MTRSGRVAPGKTVRLQEDQSKTRGVGAGFGAALGSQFAQNRVNVEFDGMFADAQPGSDRFVGQPIGY